MVVIEYNASFLPEESKVIPLDPAFAWDGTRYYGASLRAIWNLGKSKGYTLVFSNGVNAFFVQNDLVDNKGDFSFDSVYTHRTEHPPDAKNRPWVTVPETWDELTIEQARLWYCDYMAFRGDILYYSKDQEHFKKLSRV